MYLCECVFINPTHTLTLTFASFYLSLSVPLLSHSVARAHFSCLFVESISRRMCTYIIIWPNLNSMLVPTNTVRCSIFLSLWLIWHSLCHSFSLHLHLYFFLLVHFIRSHSLYLSRLKLFIYLYGVASSSLSF